MSDTWHSVSISPSILSVESLPEEDNTEIQEEDAEDSSPKAGTAANYSLQQKMHVFKAHFEDNIGRFTVVCPDMGHNSSDPLAILPPKCSLSSQTDIIKGVEPSVVRIYVPKFFTCRKYSLRLHDIFLSVLILPVPLTSTDNEIYLVITFISREVQKLE